MTPVIVTGGAGFIGKHLVHSLLDSRQKVLVVDRITKPESFLSTDRMIYKKMNAGNIHSLSATGLHKAKIVHLAAEVSVADSVRDPISTVKSNIEVTCEMLEFARKIDSERFVIASTAAVYGDHRGPCKETDPPAPASPYAASKLASEYYCKIYSSLYGIPTVILRYFNVYGPGQTGDYAGVITRFVKRGLEKKSPIILGDGRQTRDFVYVSDVVDGTMIALRRSLPGGTVLNIGTGRPVTIKLLAQKILVLLGLQHFAPTFARPRQGDVRHSSADATLAKRMMNFVPNYPLDRGLRETLSWMSQGRG